MEKNPFNPFENLGRMSRQNFMDDLSAQNLGLPNLGDFMKGKRSNLDEVKESLGSMPTEIREMLMSSIKDSLRDSFLSQNIDKGREYVARYQEQNDFGPGDLVEWKEGMRDNGVPEYGEPVMVLDRFDAIRSIEQESGVNSCKPHDMRVLVAIAGDRWVTVAVDGHLFKPYIKKDEGK